MTPKEQGRIQVLNDVVAGTLRVGTAASLLGAQQAGVHPVLLNRSGAGQRDGVQTISSLSELLEIVVNSPSPLRQAQGQRLAPAYRQAGSPARGFAS